MPRFITALAALSFTLISTSAWAQSSGSEAGTIAILVNSLDNPYFAAEAEAAAEQAEELGYTPLTLSHNGDVNRQREMMSSVVARGVVGIVLDNADSEASVAAVRSASESVPVALINREIPEDGLAISQLTHNNMQAASEVARAFVDQVGESGRYIELTCALSDINCATRSDAFGRVLSQYPDLEMISRQSVSGVLEAKQAMDSILQENDSISGVVTGSGPVALGAIASLRAADIDDVTVVGLDGSNDEISAIQDGDLYATAMLQAGEIARQAVVQLDQYINEGETGQPERQMFRGILITAQNAGNVDNFNYSGN